MRYNANFRQHIFIYEKTVGKGVLFYCLWYFSDMFSLIVRPPTLPFFSYNQRLLRRAFRQEL